MYYILFYSFLSNNLFYLFSKLALCCYRKILLIIYSLNLALCLHLAISSFLLFINFFGSGKSKMWIFSSRHRLHLLSKDFGILDLLNMDHCISGFWDLPNYVFRVIRININVRRVMYINLYQAIYIKLLFIQQENINDKKYYIGISSTDFKIRYGNHKFSFSHEHQKNQTALSKHYWGLKVKGLTPEIQWSILRRSSIPKSFDSRCNLCLEEKIHILLFPEPKKIIK